MVNRFARGWRKKKRGNEKRARWTDKLMTGYGSVESRKDKEERDTHLVNGTADCFWPLSNFGRFDGKEKNDCREKKRVRASE